MMIVICFQFIFRRDETVNPELKRLLTLNYFVMPGVQDVLITQLFKARLIKDQFVTTRTLLDFCIICLWGRGIYLIIFSLGQKTT